MADTSYALETGSPARLQCAKERKNDSKGTPICSAHRCPIGFRSFGWRSGVASGKREVVTRADARACGSRLPRTALSTPILSNIFGLLSSNFVLISTRTTCLWGTTSATHSRFLTRAYRLCVCVQSLGAVKRLAVLLGVAWFSDFHRYIYRPCHQRKEWED